MAKRNPSFRSLFLNSGLIKSCYLLFLLTQLYCTTSAGIKNSSKTLPVKKVVFQMDGRLNDPLGLPFKSKVGEAVICISEGETVHYDSPIDSINLVFQLKGDTIFVNGKSRIENKSVMGQFYVPPICRIGYYVSYDPETFDATIRPYQYWEPMRVGVWAFGNDASGYSYNNYSNQFVSEFYDMNCSRK